MDMLPDRVRGRCWVLTTKGPTPQAWLCKKCGKQTGIDCVCCMLCRPLSVHCPPCRYYLNSFYPPDQVTLPYSLVEAAVGLANVVAAPLAASLLMLDGKNGMHGWQW